MMKRWKNGEYLEMTAEEIAELENQPIPEPPLPSLEEQVIELRQALDLLLSGVTEV